MNFNCYFNSLKGCSKGTQNPHHFKQSQWGLEYQTCLVVEPSVWFPNGLRFSNGIPFFNKMAAILPKTIGNLIKIVAILLGFPMVGCRNGWDHSYSYDQPFQNRTIVNRNFKTFCIPFFLLVSHLRLIQWKDETVLG